MDRGDEMMKDFLGRELQIGDAVIFIDRGYRSYKTGHVVDFTAKNVRITIDSVVAENKKKGWNLKDDLLQDPRQLIKY
jgi:hypothetical protein